MIFVIVGSILLLVFVFFVVSFLYYKNKYDFLFLKIKEADNNLDIILEKKTELLIKIANILEKEKIEDIPDTAKLKTKKEEHHSFYQTLNKNGNDIMKIVEDNEGKIKNKEINSVIQKLEANECELQAVLKYYNDSAIDINHYIHKFPSNIVKVFCHYKELQLYKIERREIFEILKQK